MKFVTTQWGDKPTDELAAVAEHVHTVFTELRDARQNIEETWLHAWALYLNTPEALDAVRQRTHQMVGDIGKDWRHKVNKGKAFSQVETIHSYMMQAQFPSRQWFEAKPDDPEFHLEAKAISKFMAKTLEKAQFTTVYSDWLRQLIITGTSVMGLPYRYDTLKQRVRRKVRIPSNLENGTIVTDKVMWVVDEQPDVIQGVPSFEVVNTLDVYMDPNCVAGDETAPFIRVIRKRRSEVIRLMKTGVYRSAINEAITASSVFTVQGVNELKEYEGIQVQAGHTMSDMVELLEYWGDLHLDGITYHDVHAVVMNGGSVLVWEPNPYWGGRPYVIGTYIPTVNQPYAIGALQPSLGLLTVDNNLLNHRLDAMEVSIDPMYEVAADSGLDDEEIFTEPGKVYRTTSPGSFSPIRTGDKAYTITYQEQGILEQSISDNSGTPSLVSSGQVRAGERVTAAEIQSIRDAGGNRLSGVFFHIESTATNSMLKKTLRSLQQFMDETMKVEVTAKLDDTTSVLFVEVNPEDLQAAYELTPLGSTNVIEREQYIDQRVQLLGIVSQIPQLAEKVNYEEILTDIIRAFGFEDPDKYLNLGEPRANTETEVPVDPADAAKQQLAGISGQPFADAMALNGNGSAALGLQETLRG